MTTATAPQDVDVPEYTGCQNTTAPWGSVCPDCGQRLPKPFSRKRYEAQRDEERTARLYLWRDITPEEEWRIAVRRESKLAGRAYSAPPAQPIAGAGRVKFEHDEVSVAS